MTIDNATVVGHYQRGMAEIARILFAVARKRSTGADCSMIGTVSRALLEWFTLDSPRTELKEGIPRPLSG